MEKCTVGGCGGYVFVMSSGLCSRHYNRLRTTGTTDDGPKARRSTEQRFWKFVQKGAPDECWLWIGKSRCTGYGYLGMGGRADGKLLSHRASWLIHYGEIPESDSYHGAVVMHICDNRLCVNPAHLKLGTQADNVRDMDKKGRRRSNPVMGPAHHNARFTEDDVKHIRSSPNTNAELAREFGCARQVIGFVRRRVTWKHLE